MRFKAIKISTQTIIVDTNANYKIENIFKRMPRQLPDRLTIREELPDSKDWSDEDCLKKWREIYGVETKKGIAKKGDILRIKYKGGIKRIYIGDDIKLSKKQSTGFRNALTCEIFLYLKKNGLPKCVNMKISCNGKLQITGSQCLEDAKYCVKSVWKVLKKMQEDNGDIYELDGAFSGIFETVMTNIDFNIGFKIDRNALDQYINKETKHRSLFEHNFGYTGVNIKFLLEKPIDHDMLRLVEVENGWKESFINFASYASKLSLKKQEKLKKLKYNTFLVFHSGQVIMSGKTKYYMSNAYHSFIDIVQSNKSIFMEKLTKS